MAPFFCAVSRVVSFGFSVGRRMRRDTAPALAAAMFACFWPLVSASAQTLAFPGAEGFGRFTSGGRGGEVYVVTNLNDSGPGSLRDAVANRTASTPRTVVFAVSGTIDLNSTLRITQGNLTIAGQTAPGDGICLARYPLDPSNSSNVVIRFLRVRLGDVAGVENDAFSCRYASNVIIDHCSFSWSVDETGTAYINTNFTMQWCYVTESLNNSVHSKGPHGYGGIWGGIGASFHHNLLAHHNSRNPRFSGAGGHGTDGELVDMRNNVVYNWKGNSTYGGEPTATGLPSHQNMVNNYYRYGPATGTGAIRYRILGPTPDATTGAYGLFHVSGNHATASTTVTANNWNGGVQGPTATALTAMRVDVPFTVAPVVTQSALNSYPLVLAYGGCRLPARDSVDARISNEVSTGTATYRGSKDGYAGIIDSQADVGGWPTLASTPAPADADKDGMPDGWETARGLNPNLASDRNLVDAATGYTQLELYLNELAAPAFPLPMLLTQPQTRSVDLGGGFTLSVSATGAAETGALGYQWYRNGSALSGATSASYVVGAAAAVDAGDYRVSVSNGYGSVSSATATVTIVAQAPVITAQPVSLSVDEGQSAGFSVSATGAAPLSYQWYRGTDAIAGATAATLTLSSVTAAAAGDYRVIVTNPNGSTPSDVATLTVVTQPGTGTIFSTNFANDTLHAATPVVNATRTNWHVMSSKAATASGVGDDPSTPAVVETRPLTLALNAGTTSGIYQAAAVFAPTQAPSLAQVGSSIRATMTFSPRNISTFGVGLFNSGGVLPHTSHINGTGTTPGVTDTLLGGTADIIGGVQGWLGYRAAVFSGNTTTAQIVSRLAQTASPTTNRTQDLVVPGTTASYGTPAGVTVGTVANTPAGYLAFVDDATYTLVYEIVRSGADAYAIAFRIYGGSAAGASDALLFSSTASTTAAGTAPSAVATAFDSFAFGARTTSSATIPRIVVSALSIDYATPSSSVAPVITTQPASLVVNQGAGASFTAAASGSPAPVYQWRKDGVAIPGAASATYTIASAQPADAGAYTCVASNSAGSVVSGAATLVVHVPPAITLQPIGRSVVRGAPFTLAAAASGDPAPSLQWYRGDTALAGATAGTYAVASAAPPDAGVYTLVATNAAGSATSSTATIVVLTPYEAWVLDNGLDLATNGAPTADAAGDGVPNLIKFSLGGDPAEPGSTPLPTLGRGVSSWLFTYDLKIAALADYAVGAEYSTDLASWSSASDGADGVSIVATTLDSATRRVTVGFPVTQARLFVRLRVVARP